MKVLIICKLALLLANTAALLISESVDNFDSDSKNDSNSDRNRVNDSSNDCNSFNKTKNEDNPVADIEIINGVADAEFIKVRNV